MGIGKKINGVDPYTSSDEEEDSLSDPPSDSETRSTSGHG